MVVVQTTATSTFSGMNTTVFAGILLIDARKVQL